MVCLKVLSMYFFHFILFFAIFTEAQMQIKKQRISPQSATKAVRYDMPMLNNVLVFQQFLFSPPNVRCVRF